MDKSTTRALLIDSNQGIRQTIREILQDHFPDLVLNEADTPREAMEKLDELRPGVVIIELQPDPHGAIELIRYVRTLSMDTLILTLTDRDLPEYQQAALAAGTDAFLSKRDARLEQVLDSIHQRMNRQVGASVEGSPHINALQISRRPGTRWRLPTPPVG